MSERGPIAVIDIGSNSGRLVVYLPRCGASEILEDARVPLRLAGDLQEDGALSDEAVARTLDALRDFLAIARGAAVTRTIVVGTAAMRDASNGEELVERIRREAGVDVEILDGLAEARYSFLGAVHALPVEHGFVLDIGGGSLEITRFRDRRGVASWMLPLGALRTTGQFLTSDPPTHKDLRRLTRFVARALAEAGVAVLGSNEVLVGTGGTIRNLAKIDRRGRSYPIERLHGYTLQLDRVRQIARRLSGLPLAERAAVPGLNADRADSIAGGAWTARAVMEHLGASELLVSGEGLREGIALAATTGEPLPPEEVRRASIAALTARFGGWDSRRAERRAALARTLLDALEPDATAEMRETLETAATILDIGRSVDYYNRRSHTATIVAVADFGGYSHRALALLAATVQEADRRQPDLRRFAPLLDERDAGDVARAGMLLLLADELERRSPNDAPVELRCEVTPDRVRLVGLPFAMSQAARLADRFARAFGLPLELA